MVDVFIDTFTDGDNTDVAAHAPETGTWSKIGAGPGSFKIFSNRGVLDYGGGSSPTYYTNLFGQGEFDVTVDAHYVTEAFQDTFLVLCRFDPANSNSTTLNGYDFRLTKDGGHLYTRGTASDADLGGWSWVSPLSDGSDHTIVIKIRDGKKSVELDGAEAFSTADDSIPAIVGTNDRIGVFAVTAYGPSWGMQANALSVATPVSPLLAPAIAVIDATYAGWEGLATSVAPTAVGLHCPTPVSGTPAYTYQWHVSTNSGFTPDGGNLISGATGQIQLVTGLTPATTYYAKCVISDAAPSSVTTDQVSFATPAAIPAGATIVVCLGDSTGGSITTAMQSQINLSRGRSDTVQQSCSDSGKKTADFTSGNNNNWLKYAAVIAKAWGATAINYGLGINDANTGVAAATTNANVDDATAYLSSQSLATILHFVLFNNAGGGGGSTANALIDLCNAHFVASADGVTIFCGDREGKNYTESHTDLYSDALHLSDYTAIGVLRGRALLRSLGTVTAVITFTPSSIDAGTTGNVVTFSATHVGMTDGTPGSPTFTIGTGATITAKVIAALPTDGSPQVGTLTLSATTSGAKPITIPYQGTGGITVTGSVGTDSATKEAELLLLLL